MSSRASGNAAARTRAFDELLQHLGRPGYPGIATYSATKFFVYGLSEALRAELQGSGVHFSCVLPGFVDTELTAGVEDTRLLQPISPAAVAAQVADALQHPRFEVWAPKAVGAMTAIMARLPRRLREAAIRAVGADRILLNADPAAREVYLSRAEPPAHRSHQE
jgi:NAD(P)-dependent dehydrogenase (short-subunit alcohol dehydrogenase family)